MTPPPDGDIISPEDTVDFYHRVKPDLQMMESVRTEKYDQFMFRRKIGIWLSGVLSPVTMWIDYNLLFVWMRSSDDNAAGLTFMVVGAIYAWVTAPKRAYAKAYKDLLMPKIAKLFGLTYLSEGRIPMTEMQPSGLIPAHDKYKAEDYFEGTHHGARIRFSEIELKQRRRSGKRTTYVTVFKGLAILIDMKKGKFHGHTIVRADGAGVSEWMREKFTKLQRADLVDPEFENKYSVFTNDQVEARYLVDPAMIERINRISHIHVSKGVSVSYRDNRVLLLVETPKNLFEPADITIPATDAEALSALQHEVEEALSLVDYFEFYKPAPQSPPPVVATAAPPLPGTTPLTF